MDVPWSGGHLRGFASPQRANPPPCQGEGGGFHSRLPFHFSRSGSFINPSNRTPSSYAFQALSKAIEWS